MDDQIKQDERLKEIIVDTLKEVIVPSLEHMQDQIDNLSIDVSTLGRKVSTLDGKVSTLDEKVSTLDEKVTDLNIKMADVYGEVKTIREEQSMHKVHHDDLNDRVEKIETVPAVAHQLKHK